MSKVYHVKQLKTIRLFEGSREELESIMEEVGVENIKLSNSLDCIETPDRYYKAFLKPSIIMTDTFKQHIEEMEKIASLDIPDDDYWQSLLVNVTLRPFQIEFLKWMESRRLLAYGRNGQRGVLCALPQGVGKSLVGLAVDAHFRQIGFTDKTLIVCRNNNKHSTWTKHLDKYTKLEYLVIEGDKLERQELFEEFRQQRINLGVIHYEAARLHKDEISKGVDLLIVDEAQSIANLGTQQSTAVDQASEKAKYTLLLSGGVAQNKIATQLWHPLHLLDRKVWSDFYAWRDEYCTVEEIWIPLITLTGKRVIDPITKRWRLRPQKVIKGIKDKEKLAKKIAPYIYQKKREDIADQLPEKIYQIIEVGLMLPQLKLYKEIRENLVKEVKGTTIQNAMVKMIRLYQVCATLACLDMEDISKKADEATEYILEKVPEDGKALIFSRFVPLCNSMYNRLTSQGAKVALITGEQAKEDRDEVREQFKFGDTQFLIATTQIEGTGSSYEEAAYLFRLDRDFRPLQNQQTVDRIVRLNSKHPFAYITDFYCINTLEEVQLDILEQKTKDITGVMNPAADYTEEDIERMLAIIPKR